MATLAKRGRPAAKRQITQGGITQITPAQPNLTVILQSPELFHFDIRRYMDSLLSASAIDFYNRA